MAEQDRLNYSKNDRSKIDNSSSDIFNLNKFTDDFIDTLKKKQKKTIYLTKTKTPRDFW